ncbi:MAG: hypothetical protein AB7U63_12160 [Porticoccaceae bacterium]
MNKKGTALAATSAMNKKGGSQIVTQGRVLSEYRSQMGGTDIVNRAIASRRYARKGLLKAGYTPEEADAMLYRMGYRTGGEA